MRDLLCYCSDTLIIYAYCIQPRFPLLYARCTHVFFSFLRSGIATTPLPYPTQGEIALPRLDLGNLSEYPKKKKGCSSGSGKRGCCDKVTKFFYNLFIFLILPLFRPLFYFILFYTNFFVTL